MCSDVPKAVIGFKVQITKLCLTKVDSVFKNALEDLFVGPQLPVKLL